MIGGSGEKGSCSYRITINYVNKSSTFDKYFYAFLLKPFELKKEIVRFEGRKITSHKIALIQQTVVG